MGSDLPTGPEGPRGQLLYADHSSLAVLDWPEDRGMKAPPALGALMNQGDSRDILLIVLAWHPELRNKLSEVAELLGTDLPSVGRWCADTSTEIRLSVAGYWALLKLKGEAWPVYLDAMFGRQDATYDSLEGG